MSARVAVLIALALATCASRALAQDPDAPDPASDELDDDDLLTEDVVVSTTSEADAIAESADSVLVLETDVVRIQAADAGEVLARQEGISVRRGGGLGSSARICIHGICDAGIRYFLDGVPLELAGFGHGISNVPLSMVERVEIYRGAVPIRLGTDALGGVIDLVREQAYFVPHASASLLAGSWGTYRAYVDGGYRHDASGFYAGASAFVDHADNDYPIDVLVTDAAGRLSPARVRRFHDAYDAYGVAAEVGLVGVPFADRLLLRGFVNEYDRELQHNVVMTVPYGEVTYGEVSAGGLLRYSHTIDTQWSIDAFAGYTRREITFRDASTWVYDWHGRRVRERRVAGEIDPRARDQVVWEDAAPARLTLSFQLTPEHLFVANVTPEFTSRSGDERVQVDPMARDPLSAQRDLFTMVSGIEHRMSVFDDALETSLFIKDYVYASASEEVLRDSIVARHDRSTHDVGAGAAARYRIADGILARATYEYATRLPEPYEVFGDGVLVVENLDLLPERSHNATLEGSLDVRADPGRFEASIAGFVRARENMIVLLGTQRSFSYQNVYSALVVGGEASVRWTSPGDWVVLAANATYQEDRNTSAEGTFARVRGDRIPNRPFLFANFSAELHASGVLGHRDELTLGWRGRYVHEFFRGWESQGSVEHKQTVSSQLAQDVWLTYVVDGEPRISTSLEVQNLADAALFDFFGAQRPGRSFFVRVTAEL
ncbi:TonB-dependent receptor domain-containing protein [Sandaracinus amylolyticus]|uniref:TonB-dependent receptor n=1 Tax=Sandaracinus amylolyticus TaxID=927083 RepID=A0A0F6W935_9BACT|nr:TonB-dependent receptor [Sandaracinus amylolyticus]AKF10530.1 TonB-dependent receptor [Sandaracinus amylolyticus]